MITLAKFLAISGIILPMLPDDNLIPGINLTPYSIWLATVVVSGISYLSYLLKRYVFRESGILVSGIVGGLYSSTATISVLARKSRKVSAQEAPEYVAAMLLAVSMMFLRCLPLLLGRRGSCIPGGSVLPCRKRSMKTRMAAIRWSSRWRLFLPCFLWCLQSLPIIR